MYRTFNIHLVFIILTNKRLWLFIMIWFMYNYNKEKLQSLLIKTFFSFLGGIKKKAVGKLLVNVFR